MMDETPWTDGRDNAAYALNTQGTALGVVSILLAVLGCAQGLGIVFASFGVVCGVLARAQAEQSGNHSGATIAIIGTVLSSAALLLAFIMLVFVGGSVFGLMR